MGRGHALLLADYYTRHTLLLDQILTPVAPRQELTEQADGSVAWAQPCENTCQNSGAKTGTVAGGDCGCDCRAGFSGDSCEVAQGDTDILHCH